MKTELKWIFQDGMSQNIEFEVYNFKEPSQEVFIFLFWNAWFALGGDRGPISA